MTTKTDFIIAFITACGGFEAIKWVFQFWMNRAADKRKDRIKISEMEFETLKKQVEWLTQKLHECHQEMEELHDKFNACQEEKENWKERFHQSEIALQEAQAKQCNNLTCPHRENSKEEPKHEED